jgi:ferritin-like metal-binding protein YciE
MTMSHLKDVYHDQLQDLWSANTQAVDAVTKLGRGRLTRSDLEQ